MQFKVPQNVQREDTIIANITIKQLIILIGGGGLDYMIYIAMTKQGLSAILWAPPVIILGLFTVTIAFVKINNLPFYKYVLLMIEKMAVPRKRMWKKGEAEVYQGIFAAKTALKKQEKKKEDSKESEERKETLSHISRISQILDSAGIEEDIEHKEIDESHDDELLHKAYETGLDKDKMDAKKEDITKVSATPTPPPAPETTEAPAAPKTPETPETPQSPEPAETQEEPEVKSDVFEEENKKKAGIAAVLQENKEPEAETAPETPEAPEAQPSDGEIDLSQKQGTITIKK